MLVLSEKDKLAITLGFEQRNILLAEAEIARRHHQQQLALQRMGELDMATKEVELQAQIRQAERMLDFSIIEALQHILASCSPHLSAEEDRTSINMPGKLLLF
jgi:hypothetical protein